MEKKYFYDFLKGGAYAPVATPESATTYGSMSIYDEPLTGWFE